MPYINAIVVRRSLQASGVPVEKRLRCVFTARASCFPRHGGDADICIQTTTRSASQPAALAASSPAGSAAAAPAARATNAEAEVLGAQILSRHAYVLPASLSPEASCSFEGKKIFYIIFKTKLTIHTNRF